MDVSFPDHLALFHEFLNRREQIVDAIEGRLLNVRDKPISRSRDRRQFERVLDDCFFDPTSLSQNLRQLKGQLAASHLADGFVPVVLDRFTHELDPLELIVRAYEQWEADRWPGRSGRVTFAGSLFVVFVLRQLEYLSLRVWDAGHDRAEARLTDVQRVLDRLNEPSNATVFVRSAAWLLQTAQGALTRHLQPYLRIAEHVSSSFSASAALDVHRAGACLAGGHLRSQLRYRVWNSKRPIDDLELLAFNRNSNSIDAALLVGDLGALLHAYSDACSSKDVERRCGLADAILQGLAADPELLISRLDLLAPYTMLETLHVECALNDHDTCARYTRLGQTHFSRLGEYGELLASVAESLLEDSRQFDPARHVYSPYAIVYGFIADVLSNMAMAALVSQPSFGLSLEDMFASCDRLDDKRARAKGWERLPIRTGEREHFEHSIDWAQQIFSRVTSALEARAKRPRAPNASDHPAARLFVSLRSTPSESAETHGLPERAASAQEYCFTSDMPRAVSTGAMFQPAQQMLDDRNEGRFLASAEGSGHSFGVSKLILTLFLSRGQDVRIVDVPKEIAEVLSLTCGGLLGAE
jgi:hypothetical protein